MSVEEVNTLALVPDKSLGWDEVFFRHKVIWYSYHTSIDIDSFPHLVSASLVCISIRSVCPQCNRIIPRQARCVCFSDRSLVE